MKISHQNPNRLNARARLNTFVARAINLPTITPEDGVWIA